MSTNDKNGPIKQSDEPQIEFAHVRSFFKNIIKDILDLKHGVNKKATIEEINNKKSLSGANAWMLICSIMIASIGLDRNSPAVIIGAMLISPLMAPILGIGLGVGINDRRVIKTSLMHFSVAILIAIVVSTIYFLITPLGTFGSEIRARTEPTILDVLIALFGGVAGIISIARKDISTTIPGVAIATALMPPLCVTGFGIANWETNIILSSFYLFLTNTFFICLSTYIIVRLLRFPFRKYPNKKEKRRNMIYVILFSLIVIIPSILILNKVILKIDTFSNIEKMLVQNFGKDMEYLDDYKLIQNDTTNLLILKVYSNSKNPSLEAECKSKLDSLGLKNMEVKVLYTSEVNLNQFDRLQQKLNSFDKFEKFSDSLVAVQNERAIEIENLKSRLQKNVLDSMELNPLYRIAKNRFPYIQKISVAKAKGQQLTTGQSISEILVYIEWNEDIRQDQRDSTQAYLQPFLEGYFRKKEILIVSK
ncbi:TIGR00341 family protein [Portibacter marinus]|uniref:TIGR00341 family protein n=1 Tax=Portibacter marinus TaxID=2898660 RepID=UPI001F211917|nr:TIGR00341 family protein [Portibacter marinus]